MSNTERVNIENRISNEEMVATIQAGGNGTENLLQLWQQNRGYVYKIAKKYSGYAEMDDLMQEGYIGLCEAVRQYDPDRGASFINYATFWIRLDMQRYIDNCCSVVRLPVHAREEMREYNKAVEQYKQYYGHEPTESNLCAMLGVDREKINIIQENARKGQIDSLNRVIGGDDDDITIADTVTSGEDMEEDVIQELDRENMSRELWLAVDQLPGEFPEAIRHRYIDGMTMKETGQRMGVGVEYVRQMEAKAFRILRVPKRCKKFRAYYEEYLAAATNHHVGLESFKRTWVSEVEREALNL